jgi:hypothetical protein
MGDRWFGYNVLLRGLCWIWGWREDTDLGEGGISLKDAYGSSSHC